jgi:hypothetical protein
LCWKWKPEAGATAHLPSTCLRWRRNYKCNCTSTIYLLSVGASAEAFPTSLVEYHVWLLASASS